MRLLLKIPGGNFLQIQTDIYLYTCISTKMIVLKCWCGTYSDALIYVVVQFYPWFKFSFLMFLGMANI